MITASLFVGLALLESSREPNFWTINCTFTNRFSNVMLFGSVDSTLYHVNVMYVCVTYVIREKKMPIALQIT